MGKLIKKPKSISFIISIACVKVVLAFILLLVMFTFNSFREVINEAVRIQTREISTQIVYNHKDYIRSIINTSVIIQSEISQMQDDWEGISTLFREIVRLNNDIMEVSVFDYESRICLGSSNINRIHETYSGDTSWLEEAVNNPTIHIFSVPYLELADGLYSVNVSKRVRLPDGSTGVLNIRISFQKFIELVERSNLGDGGHITIIDENYNIVHTSIDCETTVEEGLEVIRELVLGTTNVVVGNYNMALNVDTLSNTKWRICVFINVGMLTAIEQDFLRSTVVTLVVILGAGILVFICIGKAITKSMKRLEFAMQRVEESDYFHMEEVNKSAFKEVNGLIWRFNKMMYKINELMDRVVTEQNALRKSELKVFQHQINPHFLYNTLESIIWVVESGKNKAASKMIGALARLYRLGLLNNDETVPLKDEIEHVRNYLLIQNFRYSDSFSYEFALEESTLGIRTMKLILQPIVENSLYHGLQRNIDKGHIKISAYTCDEYLYLSVADNGCGMRKDAVDAIYASFKNDSDNFGVGLKNVYQRIMLYYGDGADLIIESELDKGTTITIKEPLNHYERKNN